MHVRTRLKLFQRAKMWPTTYTVRLASPALRDLERIPPHSAEADPGVHLHGSAAEPDLGRQTLERELDYGAQREATASPMSSKRRTSAYSSSASTNARVYRPRGKDAPRPIWIQCSPT